MTNEFRGSPSLGIFLIGLGLVVLTGWWWPGMTITVGIAGSYWLLQQGRYTAAIWVCFGFVILPLISYAMFLGFLAMRALGPVLLVAVGVGILFGARPWRRFSRS